MHIDDVSNMVGRAGQWHPAIAPSALPALAAPHGANVLWRGQVAVALCSSRRVMHTDDESIIVGRAGQWHPAIAPSALPALAAPRGANVLWRIQVAVALRGSRRGMHTDDVSNMVGRAGQWHPAIAPSALPALAAPHGANVLCRDQVLVALSSSRRAAHIDDPPSKLG